MTLNHLSKSVIVKLYKMGVFLSTFLSSVLMFPSPCPPFLLPSMDRENAEKTKEIKEAYDMALALLRGDV